jgi:imidazolonepropionase-like amidohydrolase
MGSRRIGKLFLLLIASGALGAGSPPSALERRYTMLLSGNRAGEQVVRSLGSGVEEIHYEFNDRGRGPKLDERIALGSRGIPIAIEIAGNDYHKAPVNEMFSGSPSLARWASASETGERREPGTVFYVPLNGTPEDFGLLARALRDAPGGKLALLPAGEASVERVGELSLENGAQTRKVTQYAVTGLDFSPRDVWLDEDGAFFASVSSWDTEILAGWEASIPKLLESQDQAGAGRAQALARKLGRRPAGELVFTGANLFDSENAVVHPKTTVLIRGSKVEAVGPDGSVLIPAGAEVLDAGGKTLMPGLWDMHVHLSSSTDGLLDIANGVTTVRDLGNDPDALLSYKKSFDVGTAAGPRIVLAGLVDGSGPFSGPIKRKVDNEAQARAAVEDYARRGYVQIKIYSSIDPKLVPFIVRLAHEKNMRVSGHVPAFMTAEQFVQDGADEIQHINFLFLNFLFDDVKDTRTPARFTAVAEHAAEIDLSSERVKGFLRLLKQHDTVIDPTLDAFEDLFTARPGQISPVYTEVADRLPAQVRRGLLAGGLPVPEGRDRRYRDAFAATLKMVKALEENDIRIVAGTDAMVPGFSLPRELELYVEAGLRPARVLQIATLGAARVMKMDRRSGSIAPGKLADCILIAGSPEKRINDLRRVELVVKDGVVYKPAEVDAAIGVRPVPGS